MAPPKLVALLAIKALAQGYCANLLAGLDPIGPAFPLQTKRDLKTPGEAVIEHEWCERMREMRMEADATLRNLPPQSVRRKGAI